MDLEWFRLGWVSLLVAAVWTAWREVSAAGRAHSQERDYQFTLARSLKRFSGAWAFIYIALALATYFGLTKI